MFRYTLSYARKVLSAPSPQLERRVAEVGYEIDPTELYELAAPVSESDKERRTCEHDGLFDENQDQH